MADVSTHNAVIVFTVGAPGSGKSYSRCARFLADYWLPHKTGVHWSNFPINKEILCAHVAGITAERVQLLQGDSSGATEKELAALEKYLGYMERVQIIPEAEIEAWRQGKSHPSDFFKDIQLDGAHIAIDECHEVCRRDGGRGSQALLQKWTDWLGKIRHRSCTIEFLTQDPMKVGKPIEIHAGVRLQLLNSEDRRDPYLNCRLGDWYELQAAITGEYATVIYEVEERRILSKWKQSNKKTFTLDPLYFAFYDSYSAPTDAGAGVKGEAPKREFEKRSKLGLLFWFYRRNFWSLSSRMAFVGLVAYVCAFGGMQTFINKYLEFSTKIAAANSKQNPRPPAAVKSSPPAKPKSLLDAAKTPAAAGPQNENPNNSAESTHAVKPVVTTIVKGAENKAATVAPRAVDAAKNAAGPFVSPEAKNIDNALRVVLVSPDGIALSDGMQLAVGETLGSETLVSVDFHRRECSFEKGGSKRVLRVGGPVGVAVDGGR